MQKNNVLLVTLIPSPYIVTTCNEFAKNFQGQFTVLYCLEALFMKWKLTMNHDFIVLIARYFKFLNLRILVNFKIFYFLYKLKPNVIIVCGFQLPMLFCIFYCLLFRKKLCIMSDTWRLKELSLGYFHILIRKIVYPRASCFFPVSIKGMETFLSYGVKKSKIFIVPYVIKSPFYFNNLTPTFEQRKYHIMFSGQFITRKSPIFFLQIAVDLNKLIPNLNILILGSGPLKDEILEYGRLNCLNISYPGFVQPDKISSYYSQAKVFLFPTLEDSWGVVANEAIASGTPVIVSPNAGAANELIIHNENGFILPLVRDLWVEKCMYLLSDSHIYSEFQRNCITISNKFTPEIASNNLIEGIESV